MLSIHFIGNLAFILVACSFLVKDIFWLRLLSITASICSIAYNFYVKDTPLWVPICWNLFFISLNIYHLSKIILGMRKILLNKKEEELYAMSFRQLNLIEFAKLIRMGQWHRSSEGTELIHQGQKMDDLLMIYNGRVDILVNEKKVNELRDGQFIGEMSFLSGHYASATVKTSVPTEYVLWKQNDLKNLMSRNPALIFSLQSAMGAQLSMALHKKNSE